MKILKVFLMLVIVTSIIAISGCKKEINSSQKEEISQITTYKEVTSNLSPKSCSYPYAGVALYSGRGTQVLQPGKYFRKIFRGTYLWNNYKFWITKLYGSGTVIVRSVLEDLPSGSCIVLDGCQTLGSAQIELGPHTFSAPYDNIYYEVIVQNSSAEVSWQLYY